MTFEQWKAEVNKLLIEKLGLDSDDMEDWMWYDAYDQGHTPNGAVEEFLEDMDIV